MQVPNVSVDILVVKDGHILLGLLSKKWSSENNSTYGLPGREILFGEKFGEAINRNLQEEIGCAAKSHSIIAVNANYALGNHYIGIGAIAEIIGDPQITKPKDWQKWEWFSLNSLPENLFPPAKNLIDCYRLGVITVSD